MQYREYFVYKTNIFFKVQQIFHIPKCVQLLRINRLDLISYTEKKFVNCAQYG